MRFYYIRHAQSANNALWENTGSSKGRSEDPELTATGVRQAEVLANYICKKDAEALAGGNELNLKRDYFGFTHLYTSLMVRALETSMALSRALQIPVTAWPDVHETGGIFLEDPDTKEAQGLPGKTRSYFQTKYSDLLLPDSVTDAGWWNRPFESEADRQARARRVLETLMERHAGTEDRVAIVSHGGFYQHLMKEILQLEGENAWLGMSNTGITRLDFYKEGGVMMIYHNRTEHLSEELLTN